VPKFGHRVGSLAHRERCYSFTKVTQSPLNHLILGGWLHEKFAVDDSRSSTSSSKSSCFMRLRPVQVIPLGVRVMHDIAPLHLFC